MLYCKIVILFLIGGSSSVSADSDVDHNGIIRNVTAKCAGKKDAFGELCDRSACQQLNISCPLIPNVLCASDECGCRLVFTVIFDHLGRGGRKDVTDLCQATAAIKASTEIMDGLLSGAPDKRSIVAANPKILFLLFPGLPTLSMNMLKLFKSTSEVLFSQQPSTDSYQRLKFYMTTESALDKQISGRDLHEQVEITKRNNITDLKELERREEEIGRWITKQEKVVLAENMPKLEMLSRTGASSRKYALNRDGHIVGSRWPVYGNLLFGLLGGKTDGDAVGSRFFSPDSQRKLWDIWTLLNRFIADEVMAARQSQTKIPAASIGSGQSGNSTTNTHPFRAVSSQTMRAQYSFSRFAPLFIEKSDLLDLTKVCDLLNHAIQIAALAIDLYNTVFDKVSGPLSDQEMANYVEICNTADDLTEGCF